MHVTVEHCDFFLSGKAQFSTTGIIEDYYTGVLVDILSSGRSGARFFAMSPLMNGTAAIRSFGLGGRVASNAATQE